MAKIEQTNTYRGFSAQAAVLSDPGLAQALECRHHWVIASPSGPTSEGVCKLCGVAREFKNSFHVTGWEGASYRQV